MATLVFSNFEAGTTDSWSFSNCSIAADSTSKIEQAWSLKITSSASGTCSITKTIEFVPGASVPRALRATMVAAGTARNCRSQLVELDNVGVEQGRATGSQVSVSTTPVDLPVTSKTTLGFGTYHMDAYIDILSVAAAGEIFYVDIIAYNDTLGDNSYPVTDPLAMPGLATRRLLQNHALRM